MQAQTKPEAPRITLVEPVVAVRLRPTPELVAELWRRFFRAREAFAFGLALGAAEFAETLADETTRIYGIGVQAEPFKPCGAVIFTGVEMQAGPFQEVAVEGHVIIWDKAAMGHPEGARAACLDVLGCGPKRLLAEVGSWNARAYNYAVRVGFRPVGTFRRRAFYANRWRDTRLLDALVDDLKIAAEREQLETA